MAVSISLTTTRTATIRGSLFQVAAVSDCAKEAVAGRHSSRTTARVFFMLPPYSFHQVGFGEKTARGRGRHLVTVAGVYAEDVGLIFRQFLQKPGAAAGVFLLID